MGEIEKTRDRSVSVQLNSIRTRRTGKLVCLVVSKREIIISILVECPCNCLFFNCWTVLIRKNIWMWIKVEIIHNIRDAWCDSVLFREKIYFYCAVAKQSNSQVQFVIKCVALRGCLRNISATRHSINQPALYKSISFFRHKHFSIVHSPHFL